MPPLWSSDVAAWVLASDGGGGTKPAWFDSTKAVQGRTDYVHEHGWHDMPQK